MALIINRAILHILNNGEIGPCFSRQELDVDSETCIEFIGKHVRRLLTNPGAKEACFSAESEVYSLVRAYQKSELRFLEFSIHVCERLSGIMQANEEIPAADILVADFENGSNRYLAVLKLNYSECFTHRILSAEEGAENQLVKNTAVLPVSGGKVEEACLIPYDPMVLRILEQSHLVDGEDRNYFSELFLQCEAERSQKETADILRQIVDEVNEKFFEDHVETAARVKCAIIDESDETQEDEALNLENVARRVFLEHEEAKSEFLELAKEFGLPHEVKLEKPLVKREFKTQRFKADNGIELKFPAELFQDPEVMQFVNNSDGTVSITLKNLRKS